MLNRRDKELMPLVVPEEPAREREFGVRDLFAFLRRRRLSIALAVFAMFLIGCAYLATTPPEYAATASLVIDTQKMQIFELGDISADASITNSSVETEIQILTSSRIAEAAVKKLNLTEVGDFIPAGSVIGAIVGQAIGWVSGFFPESEDPLPEGENSPVPEDAPAPVEGLEDMQVVGAANLLMSNLVVRRVGLSYAISVTYYSSNPVLAARIANGVTDAYLADQVDRESAAARRLSLWLAERIDELRARAYEDSTLTAQEKSATRLTYENFVQRYTQAVQQQSLPESQALIISRAVPSSAPVGPNVFIVVAGSIILGGILGLGIAVARELFDRAIRTQQQLETAAQSPSLGVLPSFRLRRSGRRRLRGHAKALADDTGRTFVAPQEFAMAANAPFSVFSETLRRIKVAADTAPNGRVAVLGVVSSAPDEGKTTVAANLARQIGATTSVLLVDGDFRNPSLSWSLTPAGSAGLVQILANEIPVEDALWSDRNSNLQFLPTGIDSWPVNSTELLSSDKMQELVTDLRKRFNFVIVDLPPIMSLSDARAADHLFDGFVFLVEWGVTTRELVTQALQNSGIQPKLIGTVFNKVKLSRLRRFDPTNAACQKNAYFQRYRQVW